MFLNWPLHIRVSSRITFVLAILFLALASVAGAKQSKSGIKWNPSTQGKFVTALCRDHGGNLWVGTEDNGVWEYHKSTKRWQQFTVSSTGGAPSKLGPVLTAGTPNENALGDNHIYAIACDRLGRIWVGHLNHGVSVYNGKSWRNYDVIDGPIGARVFDIATCPVDGDVWIATNEGLTRYSLANGSWSYYTQGLDGNGLPSNQIQAIAFAKDGTLYAATQCHGLAICHPRKNYSTGQLVYGHWRTVASRFVNRPPLTPMGNGLPTNLLNDVMVAHDGTIWVATDEGLAWSRDKGKTWQFVRGRDWEAKDRGLYHGPSQQEIDEIADHFRGQSRLLLSEDYVTCVGEDDHGYIWIGHWRKGVEVLDPTTGKCYRSDGKPIRVSKDAETKNTAKAGDALKIGPRDYVATILSSIEPPLVGVYGGGLLQMPERFEGRRSIKIKLPATPQRTLSAKARSIPRLPSPAVPPSQQMLKFLTAGIKADLSQIKASKRPLAMYLGNDWSTEGNWIDRYGTFADICSTMNGDGCDQTGGYHNVSMSYRSWIGPGGRKGEYLRYWIEWNHTSRHRVLQDLKRGGRKESEWDDHGETYPTSSGPQGVACTLHLPTGVFEISTYCLNKDGFTGGNRQRDYLASLHLTPMPDPLFLSLGHSPKAAKRVWVYAVRQHDAAHGRVFRFWGGVWVRFAVHLTAPNYVTLLLHRNDSLNTTTCGVFVDRLDGKSLPACSFTASPKRPHPSEEGKVDYRSRDTLLQASDLANRLLQFRRSRPLAYMRSAPPYIILLLRYFTYLRESDIKEFNQVHGIRRPLARMARDIGMFAQADKFSLPTNLFETYCWINRTKAGQAGATWDWTQAGYATFLKHAREQIDLPAPRP